MIKNWDQMFGFDKLEQPKRMLSLSGEFLVAGELLRREMPASISIGEDRSLTVILRNGDKLCPVSVITTRDESWVIRNSKDPSQLALVLVHLPRDRSQSPEFFIFHNEDIVELERVQCASRIDAPPIRRSKYAPYSPTESKPQFSSISVSREEAEPHRGAWDKITSGLGMPKADWTPSIHRKK